MGNRAFDDFLASIQAKISNLNNTVTVLKKRAVSHKRKADDGDAQAERDLAAIEHDMKNKKRGDRGPQGAFRHDEEGLGRGEQQRYWTGCLGTSDHWK